MVVTPLPSLLDLFNLSSDTCVRRCSQDHYTEDKICLPCSPKCLPPLKSELIPDGVSACSGLGEFLGLGGCTFCHFVQRVMKRKGFIKMAIEIP
ncbi:hypothetical protein ACTXT7_002119 [Hymenolepis weldensis]